MKHSKSADMSKGFVWTDINMLISLIPRGSHSSWLSFIATNLGYAFDELPSHYLILENVEDNANYQKRNLYISGWYL